MSILLTDPRTIKKIKLPSFSDAEVEMYDGLLFDQTLEIEKCTSDHERGVQMLRLLIKSWPFVNDKQELLEVTSENLGKLPLADVLVLMNCATEALSFLEQPKRKSSNE